MRQTLTHRQRPDACAIPPAAASRPTKRRRRWMGQLAAVCLVCMSVIETGKASETGSTVSPVAGQTGAVKTILPETVRHALAAVQAEHRAQPRTDVMLPAGPALLSYAAALTDAGRTRAARLVLGSILEDGGVRGDAAALGLGTLIVLAQTYLADDDPVRATLLLELIDGAGAEALARLPAPMRDRLEDARARLAASAGTSGDADAMRAAWSEQARQLMAELSADAPERQARFAAFVEAFGSVEPRRIDAAAEKFVAFVEDEDALVALATLMTARRLTIGTDGPGGDAVDRDVAAGRPWLERVLDLPVSYLAAYPSAMADNRHPIETLVLASGVYRQDAHFDAAFSVALAERAAEIAEAIGPDHNLHYTSALEARASALEMSGRSRAAEAAWDQLIAHYDLSPGDAARTDAERRRHADAVASRAALAAREPGREDEAEAGFTDALRIAEAGGLALVDLRADLLARLGAFYDELQRTDEALDVYRSAVALSERTGADDGQGFVYMLARLGSLEVRADALDAASRTLTRARAMTARVLDADDPIQTAILDDLMRIYERRGEPVPPGLRSARDAAASAQSGSHAPIVARGRQFAGKINEAYDAYGRGDWDSAVASAEAARQLAEEHGETGWKIDAVGVLAAIESRRGNHRAALDHYRQAEAVLADSPMTTLAERQDGFLAHMQTAILAAFEDGNAPDTALLAEAFGVAQRLNRARVGGNVEQANLRRAAGSRPISAALRRLQAEQERREGLAAELALALASGEPVTPVRERIDALDDEIAALEADVETRFPAYADHLSDTVASLEQAAKVLAPNEALVLFATRPVRNADATLQTGAAIVLTRGGYAASLIGHDGDLGALARRLRCAAALTDPRCRSTGPSPSNQRGAFAIDEPPQNGSAPDTGAFDYEAAHDAYQTLLAPLPLDLALDGIDSLIIVPDSSLVAMPFHLMVTEPVPPGTDFADAPWLLRRAAVTVAPTVASFVGLRRERAGAEMASRRQGFLGIGDPLIGQQAGGPIAFDCSTVLERSIDVASLDLPLSQRGALEDVTALRNLAALPDTECELVATADAFGADAELLLHERASEAAIKSLSVEGRLDDFSVISFATHGLIAGEVGASNAGLVLTPPDEPGSDDNGLLTSAEIATLELDADFVLLSACNTAAGDAADAEGLSGLAGAFFFAGARNLLVSHWPVYSDAATRLTTGLFAALQGRSDVSRAQALRASMLAVLDDPSATSRQRHPAYWGPFMIVGEGGAQ